MHLIQDCIGAPNRVKVIATLGLPEVVGQVLSSTESLQQTIWPVRALAGVG